ncbi:hypothetical protein ACFWYW_25065 [Nonomuraea sp. NPDC059023]|uniref:hypothetical protein n=1 Tax=unclassified Nonomuraea TaxID=2593643 RepID=UPI0036B902A5
MTKPINHRITLDYDFHNEYGAPAVLTADPRGHLTVNREVSDPARGHLPLTVWLAAADCETDAACQAGCCHPVSGPLARHLIAACTRIGERVIHLTASDHQVASAALTAGRLPVAIYTYARQAGVTWTRLARLHPDYDLHRVDARITNAPGADTPPLLADLTGSAGLVVSEQLCNQPSPEYPCSAEDALLYDISTAAGLVKPGGHLAVITGHHRADGAPDPLPQIITQAHAAGLVYLQHIIALRRPASSSRRFCERGKLDTWQERPERSGSTASAPAHSDVLLFRKLTMPSSSRAHAATSVAKAGGAH